MLNIILIGTAAAFKILLCKLFALGMFLLVCLIKGKQLHFDSEQWDEYLLAFSAKQLDRLVITTYILSAILSSCASYGLLHWMKISHAGFIALVFLFAGAAISGYQYWKEKRAYIQKRYLEVPQTILQRRKNAEHEGQ